MSNKSLYQNLTRRVPPVVVTFLSYSGPWVQLPALHRERGRHTVHAIAEKN